MNPSGVAQFTSTLLPVGSDTITADWGGDSICAAANSNTQIVTVTTSGSSTNTNPLTLNASITVKATSCADSAIYKAQAANVDTWYLYCTSDALYPGDPSVHYMNIFRSTDLVNWIYDGNEFAVGDQELPWGSESIGDRSGCDPGCVGRAVRSPRQLYVRDFCTQTVSGWVDV
jgi:hypothetical protein